MIEIVAFIDVIGIFRAIFLLWMVLKFLELILAEDPSKKTGKPHSQEDLQPTVADGLASAPQDTF